MISISPRAAYIAHIFHKPFEQNPSCLIHKLSPSLFLDRIFVNCCIEDIMCWRGVNKAFFLLTREPIIWKRFLERMNIPVPPLRPTFRDSFEETDYELEQLVAQAITLDENWRKPFPQIYRRRIHNVKARVLDMKIVPGGKFLIASVFNPAIYCFSIRVYALDHPHGPRALTQYKTFSRAEQIQAKYAVYEGRQGIMIAFVRKRYQNRVFYDERRPIEETNPLIYETACVHLSLDVIDTLSHPRLVYGSSEYLAILKNSPSPFTAVGEGHCDKWPVLSIGLTVTSKEVHLVELREVREWFSNYETRIINLQTGNSATMTCAIWDDYAGCPHYIKAVRMLPGRIPQMLVVRLMFFDLRELYIVELYNVPLDTGSFICHATERYVVEETANIIEAHISDYDILTPSSDHSKTSNNVNPPPPISIFFVSDEPIGIVHHTIYPTSVRRCRGSIDYSYDLNQTYILNRYMSYSYETHILPGTFRSLVYNLDQTQLPPVLLKEMREDNWDWNYLYGKKATQICVPTPAPIMAIGSLDDEHRSVSVMGDAGDDADGKGRTADGEPDEIVEDEFMVLNEDIPGRSVLAIHRYCHPEISPEGAAAPRYSLQPVMRRKRAEVHDDTHFASFYEVDELQAINDGGGISSITWDETSGRMCIASKREQEICIMDYAHVVKPDERLSLWQALSWQK
ncbi:hypothetical protein BDQ12DRAFT_349602 [Crucibulum laeve]|uniref:F-box domain-containing protein n=1 Tax=Crucibulum laeve TaxID=68775 RepID=A0A5C3M9P0_9AGAR|nr:hypothetical protein BDQ12DRAFT_349602 [Crucibulum laeve]